MTEDKFLMCLVFDNNG